MHLKECIHLVVSGGMTRNKNGRKYDTRENVLYIVLLASH